MANIQTRSSVLAIVPEVTEGIPVNPSAATQYTALQDDFSMEPAIDVLDNAELKNSLGMSKSILGLENPTASFSHYLRHSGTEGTAPDYNDLLKAAFGSEVVAGTEYDTTSSSTTAVVKMPGGEGANFQRGQALLIKHADKAWEIRPIHSVSTDDLNLGFVLANAPASGVDTGLSCSYIPTEASHQTLTIHHYLGNGGAYQMMAGARVTELGIEFPAGELINASFSLEGTAYYFDPITIAAADVYLDFTDDNGTYAATVAAGTYKDPHQLADAIAAALNAADSAETFTCVYSNSTGKFTIATSTSALLSLLWNTGTNAANTIGDKIGFSVAANDTGATTYTSDSAVSFASPYTPTLDSADPLAAKDNRVMIGDSTDMACFSASSVSFSMSLPKTDILSTCATTGKAGSVINSREVTVSISALLSQFDADKFRRFRENDDTRFAYVFGSKTGSNWTAGKCGCLYIPNATISSFALSDADGLVQIDMELKAYVETAGVGEVYLSFV
jgi:hypothetical protein